MQVSLARKGLMTRANSNNLNNLNIRTILYGEIHGKVMNAARQILRRLDRAMGTRTRSAADYSITATISVVPDPLEARRINCHEWNIEQGLS